MRQYNLSSFFSFVLINNFVGFVGAWAVPGLEPFTHRSRTRTRQISERQRPWERQLTRCWARWYPGGASQRLLYPKQNKPIQILKSQGLISQFSKRNNFFQILNSIVFFSYSSCYFSSPTSDKVLGSSAVHSKMLLVTIRWIFKSASCQMAERTCNAHTLF